MDDELKALKARLEECSDVKGEARREFLRYASIAEARRLREQLGW